VYSGTVINPWVTIGPRASDTETTTIGPNANIGTGAMVIGSVNIASGAVVGANALVLTNVAEGHTVVGTPAAPIAKRTELPESTPT
jgi:serine O-acetyltransferase